MARIIDAFSQFFDGNGDPLVNGFLHFYESGTNDTDKNTYKDINETIPNTNPVQLDGEGRCPNVFGAGSYNVISYTSDMVQIQQFDPVSAGQTEGAFADWNASTTYNDGDIVIGPDGLYYRSIINNNQGQDPSATPEAWEEFYLIGEWNINITYSLNDNVIYEGTLYRSRVNSNLGFQPDTNGDKWEATGGSQMLGDAVVKAMFYNAQTIAEDITVGATQNALSAGPITIDPTFTVDIEVGGTWVIV